MVSNFDWSSNFGRWVGVPVRIHMFLVLFLVVIFGLEWNVGASNSNLLISTAMITSLVLIGSVLIHELAHAYAAVNLGGQVNDIVLTPWGGLSDFSLPRSGISRTVVFAAGPFVNCAIFLFGTALIMQSGNASLESLLNPFQPHRFSLLDWQLSLVKITTWVNFQLMLLNLLPCFPFDGAQIVRSLIQASNIDSPQVRIETGIKLIGTATGIGIIGVGCFLRNYQGGPLQPVWAIAMLLGIALLYCARYSLSQETQIAETDWEDIENINYDAIYADSNYFDFSDEPEDDDYSQWLTEKRESRREAEREIEQDEERQADEILKKLHGSGDIQSLSEEERAILDRVSARIRKRRQQGV